MCHETDYKLFTSLCLYICNFESKDIIKPQTVYLPDASEGMSFYPNQGSPQPTDSLKFVPYQIRKHRMGRNNRENKTISKRIY